MKISPNGVNLLKDLEHLRLSAYKDASGYAIGYGHTVLPHELQLLTGSISHAKAEQLLKQDLERFEKYVNQFSAYVETQSQFDALAIFAYNVGSFGIEFQTALKAKNHTELKRVWRKYNKSNGVVLKALIERREREISLFDAEISPFTKGLFLASVCVGACLYFLS